MATITSNATGNTLTVNKNKEVKGTISWSKPTVPSGATISSCVLTGKTTASMSNGSVTIKVNGTAVTSGSTFTINLGTANNTTSVTTTAKGSDKNSAGTVSFSNLVYTVTYTEPAPAQKNTYIFSANEDCGYVVANGQTYTGKTVNVEVGVNEELSFTIYPNSGYIISSVIVGGMNDEWNSESPYSMSVDGNGNYFGEATISIVYTKKVEEILLNTVIINSNEDWGYVENLTTNEIYTGTNIVITGPNTEDIDLMICPNEGYYIASVYDGFLGEEDVGRLMQYLCWIEASSGNNTKTYTYEVTYAKNIVQYTVTFKDHDGTTLKTQTVDSGSSATAPSNPTRDGYEFTGWDKAFTNITSDLTVTAQYTKIETPDEEPELTEPVDGYIAKNLVSYGDWSYTFNIDWDTQYLDIEVLSYEIGVFAIDYYYNIKNNSYEEDYTHESANGFTIHDVEVESLPGDIDIIRYSKVDGVCIITSNGTQIIPGNSFANDTKITIEADVSTELFGLDDGFMTFNIKITDITPSEEPEESKTQNLVIGNEIINELFIGEQEIKEIYLGDNLLFKK